MCDRVATFASVRMTIIAEDGHLVGDSRLNEAELRQADNHNDRPEVIEAKVSGVGFSTRYSETLEIELLYVAVPFETQQGRGIVRLAVPASQLQTELNHQRQTLIIVLGIGFVLVIAFSFFLAHLLAKQLSHIASRASRLARGMPVGQISKPRAQNSLEKIQFDIDMLLDELALQRDRLDSVLQTMVEGVVAIKVDGTIQVINDAAAAFFDQNVAIPGAIFANISPSAQLVELTEELEAEEVATTELTLQGPPSRSLRAYARLGRLGDTVLVLQDITSLRQLERMRTDFISNVSHELRTPTAVIRANAETLVNGAMFDEEGPRFLNAILRNSDRLSRIISDLLALSQIESGQRSFETTAIELHSSVEDVIEDLQLSSPKTLIKNEIKKSVKVWGDLGALDQVLVNLLENATKYAGNSQIIVRAHLANASRIRVEIVDHGPGIDKEHRTRIFERFYRINKSRSRALGGTGLGLSIVKHLTAQMTGKVGLEPNKPSGCIFWFELPNCSSI